MLLLLVLCISKNGVVQLSNSVRPRERDAGGVGGEEKEVGCLWRDAVVDITRFQDSKSLGMLWGDLRLL